MSIENNPASALKLALAAKSQRNNKTIQEPIAIIGMGCRFPGGADTPDNYWDLLANGKSGIIEVPRSRWNLDEYFDEDKSAPGKMYSRFGGFIHEPDLFDAEFFNIPRREAVSVDPQHRLLLETGWEALENAGYSPCSLSGVACGVFIGMFGNDYMVELMSQPAEEIDAYMGIGNFHSLASGRLSYLLGLQGPSIAVDAACASSLVSIHLACQSLRVGESDLALAGGAHRILSPEFSISFCKAHMLSPNGRCMAFDDRANGFVRGEGAGVVVLKRLSDAIADRDSIVALIRGSAVNQDGATSSLTVPNGLAQQRVIREALHNAQISANQVGYVEAHGTGTPIGDPIEFGALNEVYGKTRQKNAPLMLGAVKTNIGHLEGAAGVAGLIKSALVLDRQQIPPTLNFTQPNQHIDWQSGHIEINTQLQTWQEKNRFAAVSSFGLSGTNAHIILESAPQLPVVKQQAMKTQTVPCPYHIMTLSAKSHGALHQLIESFHQYLSNQSSMSIEDLCYTLNTGRDHMPYRVALVADSIDSIVKQLAPDNNLTVTCSRFEGSEKNAKVIFIFDDKENDICELHRQLYYSQSIFRQAIDKCLEIINCHYQTDLSFDNLSLTSCVATQKLPAYINSFILQYALAQWWLALDISPALIAVNGRGAYAAACVANVFSLADSIELLVSQCHQSNAETACFTNCQPADFNFIDLESREAIALDDQVFWTNFLYRASVKSIEEYKSLDSEKIISCNMSIQEPSDWATLLDLLADLYVSNIDINWQNFEKDNSSLKTRLRLPTYPFSRSSYWIESRRYKHQSKKISQSKNALHSMVHKEQTVADELIFSSCFSGDEFFFVDHKINQKKLFPATAYLELARAAAELLKPERIVIGIRETSLQRALFIQETLVHVHIHFKALEQQDNSIAFSIISSESDIIASLNNDSTVIHAQGIIDFAEMDITSTTTIDIKSLRQGLPQYLDQQTCSHWYSSRGVYYGPQFSALQEVFAGFDKVLGRLSLPEKNLQYNDLVLHPGLLDSAMQSIVGFANEDTDDVYLPVTLENINIYSALTQQAYVVAECRDEQDAELKKYDFTIANTEGQMLAQLIGLTVRRYRGLNKNKGRAITAPDITQYYVHRWVPAPLKSELSANVKQQTILIFDNDNALADALTACKSKQSVIRIEVADTFTCLNQYLFTINPQNKEDFFSLFTYLKQKNVAIEAIIYRALFSTESTNNTSQESHIDNSEDFLSLVSLSQVLTQVLPGGCSRLCYFFDHYSNIHSIVSQRAIAALFKTQHKEDARRAWQLVECQKIPLHSENDTLVNDISSELAKVYAEIIQQELLQVSVDYHVYYCEQGNRHLVGYQAIEKNKNQSLTFKNTNPVIVITGGNGGLARAFAKYFCKNYFASVILLGRSQPLSEVNDEITLINQGQQGFVEYKQADVCDYQQLHSVLECIRQQYGAIHGVIHSAAVINDSLLVNKNSEKIKKVLAPKCTGTEILDQLTASDPLEFFVLFSSLASVMGNFGQADYADGNSVLDYFAQWREVCRQQQHRQGKSISINWPAWPLGLGVDATVAERLRAETGMGMLKIEEGLKAFEQALMQNNEHQMLVFVGNTGKFENHLQKPQTYSQNISKFNTAQSANSDNKFSTDNVSTVVNAYIKEVFSRVLKLPVDHISLDQSFESFHIDSITMMDLTAEFEKKLGEVSKTLLYENVNFIELSRYIEDNYADKFTAEMNREQVIIERIIDPIDKIEQLLITSLKKIIADVLKVLESDIEIDKSWDVYNIDSIMILDITHKIQQLLNKDPRRYCLNTNQ